METTIQSRPSGRLLSNPLSHFEAWMKVSGEFNANYAVITLTANNSFFSLHDEIESLPLYRQQVKRVDKRIGQWWQVYWRTAREAYGKRYGLWFDSANEHTSAVAHDVEILYHCMLRVLLRHRVGDASLVARAQMMRELHRQMWYFYRDFWTIATKVTGYDDLHRPFEYANPEHLVLLTDQLAEMLSPQNGVQIDFGEDKDCSLALEVIRNKFLSRRLQDSAAETALDLNPDDKAEFLQRKREVEGGC